MKMLIDGQKQQTSADFVSHSILNAYQNGSRWNPKHYYFVDIGGIVPAWITLREKEELAKLKNLDDIEVFVERLDLQPVLSEDLLKWQQASDE